MNALQVLEGSMHMHQLGRGAGRSVMLMQAIRCCCCCCCWTQERMPYTAVPACFTATGVCMCCGDRGTTCGAGRHTLNSRQQQ